MSTPNSTDRRNYRSLIIAGTGTIGTSLVSLGADLFPLFDHIYAVDRSKRALEPLQHTGFACCCGDISDAGFVNTFLRQVPGPSLLVNLCAGTNNVRIRKSLTGHDTAYLDSSASMTEDPKECRFSRPMPYT
jgi:saccharopine dehydrogenase-like NADP-dependent oxidoreductase